MKFLNFAKVKKAWENIKKFFSRKNKKQAPVQQIQVNTEDGTKSQLAYHHIKSWQGYGFTYSMAIVNGKSRKKHTNKHKVGKKLRRKHSKQF